MKITLTDNAIKRLTELNARNVRVYVANISWCGVALGVLPDIVRDKDIIVEVGDFNFLIEKSIEDAIGEEIKIDYISKGLRKGFKVYK